MNAYVIVGIVIIAIGTLLMSYGGVIQSRRDSEAAGQASQQQLDDIARQLAELRGKPRSQLSKDAVSRVEGDIKEWASKFASEKQKRALEQQQMLNEHEATTQHTNSLIQDYFRFLVSLTNQLVKAYSEESLIKSQSLPEVSDLVFHDLQSGYEGILRFNERSSWTIIGRSFQPTADVAGPCIEVYFDAIETGKTVGPHRGELLVRFTPDARQFHVRCLGEVALATNQNSFSKPATEFEGTIKTLLKNMFEYELLRRK